MINVVGFYVSVLAMCIDQDLDSTSPTTYHIKKQIVMTFDEAYKCSRDIAKWIIPRNSLQHQQNSIMRKMLKLLQISFLTLPRLLQPYKEYEQSLQQAQCVEMFTVALVKDEQKDQAEAGRHERELLAWVEAEKNTATVKPKRPGKTRRKCLRKKTHNSTNTAVFAPPLDHMDLHDAAQQSKLRDLRQNDAGLQWTVRQEKILNRYQQHKKHDVDTKILPERLPVQSQLFTFGNNTQASHPGHKSSTVESTSGPYQLMLPPSSHSSDVEDVENVQDVEDVEDVENVEDVEDVENEAGPSEDKNVKKINTNVNAWMDENFLTRFEAAVKLSRQNTSPSLILAALTNDVKHNQDDTACVLCLVKPRNTMLLPCQCVVYCDECASADVAKNSLIFCQCPLCRHIVLTSEKIDIHST